MRSVIVLGDPDEAFRATTAQALVPNNGRQVAQFAQLSDLRDYVAEHAADVEVVVLGPHLFQSQALDAAEGIRARSPEVSVVLLTEHLNPSILQGALRTGVRDVLGAPFDAEALRDSVERAEAASRQFRERSAPARREAGNGKVLTVFSTKGGCGKSFVATNFAVLLAQQTGEPVALVDLDLASGDLAIMLGLDPAWNFHDLITHGGEIDRESVSRYLTPYDGKVWLLAAPTDPTVADGISGPAVRATLAALRQSFRHVVVDAPSSFNDHLLAALDETEECLLIATLDVPSVKAWKLALQTLAQLGMPRSRIGLILNRADSKVGLSPAEVTSAMGTSIDVSLPSTRDVPLSINEGTPLAVGQPKAPVVKALAHLARRCLGAASSPLTGSGPTSSGNGDGGRRRHQSKRSLLR